MTEVLKPLPGETTIPSVAVEKPASNAARLAGILGVMVLVLGGIGFGVAHFMRSSEPVIDAKPASTQSASTNRSDGIKFPDAASAAAAAAAASEVTVSTGVTKVPGIQAQEGDAKAIPLNGSTGGGQSGTNAPHRPVNPDDAPIFADHGSAHGDAGPNTTGGSAPSSSSYSGGLQGQSGGDPAAAATANLNAMKTQLGGLMGALQKRLSGASGSPAAPNTQIAIGAAPQPKAQLFGSMDQSSTARVSAHLLGDRSMIAPKGTLFLCSLKTRVVSATAGFIGCQTERNVFSDDGKVVLLERGSHLDGEYRVVDIKPGVTRVPVIWTRIRTSNGVVIDLDSPATGQLGESGLDGYVDNRWGERLGAAVLLSLVQDAIQFATTPKNSTGSTSVILPNTTTQSSKLAETVLNTTINIPPLLYQNQGGVVGVYVARDLDFSSVYELQVKQAAN